MNIPERACLLFTMLAVAGCGEKASTAVAVRDPSYLVVRPIRRDADAEHTLQVDLPMAGGGYGFAAATPLLDMASFELGEAKFLGGRTSTVGSAAIWVPLKPEANPRLAEWSARAARNGDLLGIFVKGKLVAAPRMRTAVGGGILIPVPSKTEGDAVLKELRGGGAPS
jgi:hypothetical protein